jgi:hypothetical protein
MTQRLMANRSKAGGTERKLRAAGCFLPPGNDLPRVLTKTNTFDALLQLLQEMQS